MPKVNKAVIIPVISCVAAVACTSAIWIGAYYIGVKGKDDTSYIVVPPDQATTTEVPTVVPKNIECISSCEFHLVESIPMNLTYDTPPPFMATTDAWLKLINAATSTIDITSYYWTLLPEDTGGYADYTAEQGQSVFNALVEAAKNKSVQIRITQNAQANPETAYLAQNNLAKVRTLNFTYFMGSGILHTKAWTVDGLHMYVGSANLDWRSLTQVKELGVAVFNCPCLVQDMDKMMEVYWQMGAPNKLLPDSWPASLSTTFNKENAMSVRLNNAPSVVYLSSAPPELCPEGRESDIQAILRVIATAREFIHISVMDYIPAILFAGSQNRYWGDIDDALRTAAYRFVKVKLLISRWANTKTVLYPFLRSLADADSGLQCITKYNTTTHQYDCLQKGSIEVRIFEVPSYGNQSHIPYARVNHNKYMVTDNTVYIGTSNWSGDYFVSTGGFGIVIQGEDIMQTSEIVSDVNQKIFLRDWNSQYAKSIYNFDNNGNPIA